MKKNLTEIVFLLNRRDYYVRGCTALPPMNADWKHRVEEDYQKRGK